MNYPHIGAESAAALITTIAFGLILPIAAVIFWKLKTKQPISVFICGAVIFFVFAGLLESGILAVLMAFVKPFGEIMQNNTAVYVIVGVLAAGIFEETGRFLAFKKFLKKHNDRRASVAYGIGHGGFETMMVLCLSSISLLLYTTMINAGQFDTIVQQIEQTNPDQVEVIKAIPQQIADMSMVSIIPGIVERISAMMIHIALSMLVFCGVKVGGKGWMYPLAIALHAIVDIPAALYQKGVFTNMAVFEAVFFVIALALLIVIYNLVYKKQMSGLIDETMTSNEAFPMYVEREQANN